MESDGPASLLFFLALRLMIVQFFWMPKTVRHIKMFGSSVSWWKNECLILFRLRNLDIPAKWRIFAAVKIIISVWQ